MNVRSLSFSAFLLSISSTCLAAELCEFNDPVTGTTAGCTQSSVGGSGGTEAFSVKKNGVFLMYVEKNRTSSGSCSLGGTSIDYYASGTCVNYRVYDNPRRPFAVRRHTNAPELTNAAADDILAKSSRLLVNDDGSSDITCNVRLIRNGNVTTFTAGDGTIDSEAEMTALPNGINLVSRINWCGFLAPNIVGCAPRPGTQIAVIQHPLANIIWAHEVGHSFGLTHRNHEDAIMHETVNSFRDSVSSTECNSYRGQ